MNINLTLATKTATLTVVLVLSAMASQPRNWKNATLLETAHTREALGAVAHGMAIPGYGGYGPSMGTGSAQMVYRTWQAFTIQDESYTFMVDVSHSPAEAQRHGARPGEVLHGKGQVLPARRRW